MGRREPTAKQISQWREAIKECGTKRINMRALLHAFGYKKRGSDAIRRILQWMAALKPPIYVHGLDYSRSLDKPVGLSYVEQKQIGDRAEKEEDLMVIFVEKIMPKLGLHTPTRGYSPPGTRDQLDFICKDGQGRSVVVEIKKGDGEKRVVEQVLKYIRLIRNDPDYSDP